jgi:hypothetical protein
MQKLILATKIVLTILTMKALDINANTNIRPMSSILNNLWVKLAKTLAVDTEVSTSLSSSISHSKRK